MLTITMPRAIDASLKQIVLDEMERCVVALAAKYNLDTDEAREELIGEIKFNKKRGPIPKLNKGTAVVNVIKRDTASGYLKFSHAMRKSINVGLNANLGPDEKLKPQVIIKELAVRWKMLTEHERSEWNRYARNEVMEAPPIVRQPAQAWYPVITPGKPASAFASGIIGNFTMEQLVEIQTETMADDVSIDFETMTYWNLEQLTDYFESGGEIAPEIEGVSKLPLLRASRQPQVEEEVDPVPMDSGVAEDSEEECEVSKFEIEGVMYLKDEENGLYDINSHEMIGVWNPVSLNIQTVDDDE